jgi:hypothetical protein
MRHGQVASGRCFRNTRSISTPVATPPSQSWYHGQAIPFPHTTDERSKQLTRGVVAEGCGQSRCWPAGGRAWAADRLEYDPEQYSGEEQNEQGTLSHDSHSGYLLFTHASAASPRLSELAPTSSCARMAHECDSRSTSHEQTTAWRAAPGQGQGAGACASASHLYRTTYCHWSRDLLRVCAFSRHPTPAEILVAGAATDSRAADIRRQPTFAHQAQQPGAYRSHP